MRVSHACTDFGVRERPRYWWPIILAFHPGRRSALCVSMIISVSLMALQHSALRLEAAVVETAGWSQAYFEPRRGVPRDVRANRRCSRRDVL